MNHCRICRAEAASSSLSNNFGPTPDPTTQLCPPHLEAWYSSPEHARYSTGAPGIHHLADFVRFTYAEEKRGQRIVSTPVEVLA